MELCEIKNFFEKELLEKCIPFWLENAQDNECGGILHCLDKSGKIFSLDKGVWMQGRAGWMFSYIYNNFDKNEDYLTFAKSCIDFAREKCILPGGKMSLSCTRQGGAVTEQGSGWFSETFYISACAEYYLASKNEFYLEEARRCYDLVVKWYKDEWDTPCQEEPGGKRLTRPFSQPMILLNVTNTIRNADPARADVYNAFADRLYADVRLFHSDEYHATLENISVDGRIITESATCRIVTPGHDIECSWFILEEAIERGDKELAAFAEQMFNEAYELGYDKEYGGLVYNKDILGAPVEAYEQDMKIWWVHNETVIAALMFYLYTGKERYKEILDEMLEYSVSHFLHESGEWYASLNREGRPTAPDLIGFIYKGPFHVPRMYAKCLKLLENT